MLCDNRDSLQTFSMFYALFPRTLVHSFSTPPPNCSFLQTFCITSPHASAFLVYMIFFPSLFCSHPLSPDAAEFIYLFILNHMRLRWPLRWQSRCKMWHSVYHGKNNTRVMSLRTLFWTYSSFELTDKREEASWVIGSFLK